MSFTQESAVTRAKNDLAGRLNIGEADIETQSVEEKDFPNMSLGAPVDGEMSAQMIASGWQIELAANGETYEYRADPYQLRLVNFDGCNHIVGQE